MAPRRFTGLHLKHQLILFLRANGYKGEGKRRADFLFYFPGEYPIVIEIDGDEHSDKLIADKQRDDELSNLKIDTFRIPNHEIDNGHGKILENLKQKISQILVNKEVADSEKFGAQAVIQSSSATQIQFVLLDAIEEVSGNENVIDVKIKSDCLTDKIIEAAVYDLNEIIRNYMAIFRQIVNPSFLLIPKKLKKANFQLHIFPKKQFSRFRLIIKRMMF